MKKNFTLQEIKRRRKRRILKKRINLLILAIVVIAIFYNISIYINNQSVVKEVDILENVEENTYKISGREKSIETISVSDNRSLEIEELINTYYSEYKDNLGIIYYNLETGDEYTLNEDDEFYAASTTKVAQAMMVLDEVQKGNLSLDDILVYDEEDYEEGTGSLQYYYNAPNLTVEEAIYLSITESDNIAKNMLKKVVDKTTDEYMKEVTNNVSLEDGNYTTARDLYLLLKKLYINEDNNPYYEDLIQDMKETLFHSRLDKYIDYDIVAHKIGSYNRYYHDIGIIYAEDPYILVILTKDIGTLAAGEFEDEMDRYVLDWRKEAEEVIAEISKDIYDIVSIEN